jgi:hypothetical protein
LWWCGEEENGLPFLSLVFSGLLEFRFDQQIFPAFVTVIASDSMAVIAGDAILRLRLLFFWCCFARLHAATKFRQHPVPLAQATVEESFKKRAYAVFMVGLYTSSLFSSSLRCVSGLCRKQCHDVDIIAGKGVFLSVLLAEWSLLSL